MGSRVVRPWRSWREWQAVGSLLLHDISQGQQRQGVQQVCAL